MQVAEIQTRAARQVAIRGSMGEIADMGMQPVSKAVISTVGRDQSMTVSVLVAEIMAHVQVESNPWRAWAHRIIDLSTDGRVFFLEQIGKQLKEKRKENAAITATRPAIAAVARFTRL